MSANIDYEERLVREALEQDALKKKESQPVEQKPADVVLPVEPIQSAQPIQEAPVIQQDTTPQESWKYLREERERLERRLDQERKEKEELIRYMQQQQVNQQQPEPVEAEYQAPDDEYLEGKDLNKYHQQMKLKLDRESKARQDMEKRMYEMMVQQQLMFDLPDYKQVFTADNLDRLEKMNPDLAKSLLSNPDPRSKRKATYDAIKALVVPNKKNEVIEAEYKAQSEKVSKNFAKPLPTTGSIGSATTSPLSKANAFSDGNLTQERKDELFSDWSNKFTAHYNFKK